VAPGSRVVLPRDFDPAFKAGIKKKKYGEELLRQGVEMLADAADCLAGIGPELPGLLSTDEL
jgi:hypothetical protein